MKRLLLIVLLLAAVAYAGDTKTLNMTCGKAIEQAPVVGANRHYTSHLEGKVMEFTEHRSNPWLANMDKKAGQTPRVGTLVFEPKGDNCAVTSNGNPADKVLKDLTHE